ncbi:hypothetical protein F3Y22_tig00002840pilonHSYRG00640 [Hibiscus syriacus]|uniref:Non-haem dioxygenase N-terminal domain-containing protein n=1 Tax=Hibiscus syriacus TaxID=106335 RepID=A0A6A3CVK6_HIBSY|nr:probable 2-oxoacid dependent dioxygenase [Hibiscus syriacus]KAE8731201.1 hypothetical protein F3Y22_tig00002840pilonHSYRG00640 [Hibiscus syriacus]
MAIDGSKYDIKGLVDASLAKLPQVLDHNHLNLQIKSGPPPTREDPIDYFANVNTNSTRREVIIDEIRSACKKWGLFQLVNHIIPVTTLEEIINRICRFNEQDIKAKEKLYSREESKKVTFNTKIDMSQALATYWRGTLTCVMAPNPPTLHSKKSLKLAGTYCYTTQMM